MLILKFLYYGKDYPAGYEYFRVRLRKAFIKNSTLTNEDEITNKLEKGEFVIKELDALYKLRKYRFIKRNYYDTADEERKNLENHKD